MRESIKGVYGIGVRTSDEALSDARREQEEVSGGDGGGMGTRSISDSDRWWLYDGGF